MPAVQPMEPIGIPLQMMQNGFAEFSKVRKKWDFELTKISFKTIEIYNRWFFYCVDAPPHALKPLWRMAIKYIYASNTIWFVPPSPLYMVNNKGPLNGDVLTSTIFIDCVAILHLFLNLLSQTVEFITSNRPRFLLLNVLCYTIYLSYLKMIICFFMFLNHF